MINTYLGGFCRMGFIDWIKEFFGIGTRDDTETEDILKDYDTEVTREKKSKQNDTPIDFYDMPVTTPKSFSLLLADPIFLIGSFINKLIIVSDTVSSFPPLTAVAVHAKIGKS